MDPHRSKAIGFFNGDAQNAASVTVAAAAGKRHVIEHISGSSDAAATVTLESPDGTVLWSKVFGAAFTFSETFPPGAYVCGVNAAAVLKVSAGTTGRNLNIAGYDIPG